MADYETARRTAERFRDRLHEDRRGIVSIGPRIILDSAGKPTEESVIVVGVLRDLPEADASALIATLPRSLPAVAPDLTTLLSETVEVIVERRGRMVIEENVGRLRPCPGAYGIATPGSGVGTLGGIVRREFGDWCYILSNNHVLARNSSAGPRRVRQPAFGMGSTGNDTIAITDRFELIQYGTYPNEVDCAIALVLEPYEDYVCRAVKDIGVPAKEGNARCGQAVRKSGYTTELTTGTITSLDKTVYPSYGGVSAKFVRQIEYTRMTKGGDSGSLIWDGTELEVVGLHFMAEGCYSYGNHIRKVLDALNVSFL